MTSRSGRSARSNDGRTNSESDRIPVTSFTTTRKCCTRRNCAKYGLFVVNFLVWVAGGVLMGFGTWTRLQRNTVAAFDQVTVDVAYLLIGIGAVMFVVSFFGCLGALRESLCLLKAFIIFVVIVFVAQMVAGVLAFVMLDTVERKMMDLIRQSVVRYQTPHTPSMDQALEDLQRQYKCCGGASYKDWEASPKYNCSGTSLTACDVPPSCCIEIKLDCGERVMRYSENFAKLKIYTRGCIGGLMSIFKENLVTIGLIAFAVGFLQVCSLLMVHCMMRYIVSDDKLTL